MGGVGLRKEEGGGRKMRMAVVVAPRGDVMFGPSLGLSGHPSPFLSPQHLPIFSSSFLSTVSPVCYYWC